MMCVRPSRIPNKSAVGVEDAFITVSCGKCYACLSNRRRSWLFRLQYESLYSELTLFCTLTYEDYYCDGDLHKDDLQKFLKKLRNKFDFRYYAIGEYGTNTHRPHYHLVLFVKDCISLDDANEFIYNAWNKGFVSVSRSSYRRLNYVLHYHTRPKVVNGKKTFQLFSKGLGRMFLTPSIVDYLIRTGSSVVHDFNGSSFVLPRYYIKKLKEDNLIFFDGGVFKFEYHPFKFNHKDFDNRFYRVFGKHLYEVPEDKINSYIEDLIVKDFNKLNKYNYQDKFM